MRRRQHLDGPVRIDHEHRPVPRVGPPRGARHAQPRAQVDVIVEAAGQRCGRVATGAGRGIVTSPRGTVAVACLARAAGLSFTGAS